MKIVLTKTVDQLFKNLPVYVFELVIDTPLLPKKECVFHYQIISENNYEMYLEKFADANILGKMAVKRKVDNDTYDGYTTTKTTYTELYAKLN